MEPLKRCVFDLASDDPRLRVRAMREIYYKLVGECNFEAFVAKLQPVDDELVALAPKLIRNLTDEHLDIAMLSEHALKAMGPRAAFVLPELESMLRSDDRQKFWRACERLKELGPAAAPLFPLLLKRIREMAESGDIYNYSSAAALHATAQGNPEFVRQLVRALWDEVRLVRNVAASALGMLGPESSAALPSLLDLAKDKAARACALGALGGVGQQTPSDVLPALIDGLNDEEIWVRANAVHSLTKIGPPAKAAVPRLVEMLSSGEPLWDDDLNLQTDIFKALLSIAPETAHETIRDQLAKQPNNFEAGGFVVSVASIGGMSTLLECLNGDAPNEARKQILNSAHTSAEIAQRFTDKIVNAAHDPDEGVREAAVRALESCSGSGVEAALLLALKDRCAVVRVAAVTAIEKPVQNNADVTKGLIAALDDGNTEVRQTALRALCKVAPKAAAAPAARMAEKEMPAVRTTALSSIRELLKPEEALPLLVKALTARNVEVREAAIDEIGEMGKDAASAIPALIAALEDRRRKPVKKERVEKLRNAVTPDAVAFMLDFCPDKFSGCRAAAAEALGKLALKPELVVPALNRALEDPRERVLYCATVALGEFGPPALCSLPSLLAHFEKALPHVVSIHDLMNHINETPLGEAWQDAKGFCQMAAVTLGKIGSPKAISVLIKALGKPDASLQTDAAEALGRFGPAAREALPALNTLATHKNSAVAAAALDAIDKISKT